MKIGDKIMTTVSQKTGLVERIDIHKSIGKPFYAVKFVMTDKDFKIIEPKKYSWTTVRLDNQ
jgi:hypothetical protein